MLNLSNILLLVFHLQKLVSSENVLGVDSTHGVTHQLVFPRQRDAQNVKPNDLQLASFPDGKQQYKIHCETYDNVDTKVDVFTIDGVLLETLTMANIGTPCDQSFLENHVTPKDPPNKAKSSSSSDPMVMFNKKEENKEDVREEVRIIYLMRSKTPRCVQRVYTIGRFPMTAEVVKSDYPITECPEKVKKFIASNNNDYKQIGGVVGLTPIMTMHDMDYYKDIKTRGAVTRVPFPKKDIKGKEFTLVCWETTLNGVDPTTEKDTALTGYIEHEDRKYVMLEKFHLNHCMIDYINVNRRIVDDSDTFKIVYKMADARCFEKTVKDYVYPQLFVHFNQYAIEHSPLMPVACPTDFVGDINMNAWKPWYKHLLSFIFSTKPFEEEISTRANKLVESSSPGKMFP